MAAINTDNPNVAYNYQKYSNLTTSNVAQSKAGLTIALRDRVNVNRNANFIFPNNLSTPNFGAGSPTILSVISPPTIDGVITYMGYQVTY